jgi:ribonucleoside-diphosphate reductase alpha chain
MGVLVGKLSHARFEPSGWTGNQELGYAKSIMDYHFRWLELRFLSGTQLLLFVTTAATSASAGEAPNHTPRTGVSTLLEDAYGVGDAPLCSACGALMVRNGSCLQVRQLRGNEWLQLISSARPQI